MDHGFSILMFIFAAALLAYAALMAITKNYNILPWRATVSVNPKDKRAYTFQLAKVIALVAAAIAAGAAVALLHTVAGVIVMIAAVIAAIVAGTKIMKKVM